MWNGNRVLEWLQSNTAENREKMIFCGAVWSPWSIDEWIEFHPHWLDDEYGKGTEKRILAMPLEQKAKIVYDICYSYFNRDDDLEEDREINDMIENALHKYIKENQKEAL